MVEKVHNSTLLIALMKRSRMRWRWVITLLTAVLLLWLILVAYLEGVLTPQFLLDFWQNGLRGPVMLVYILAACPLLWRVYVQAVQSFQSLLPVTDEEHNQLLSKAATLNHRWEWVALFGGAVFYLALLQPWARVSDDLWLDIYVAVTHVLMFSLLGWLIYFTLGCFLRISRLGRQQLNWNMFDSEVMSPIARWSLGISLGWVGGVSLSLVFQSPENLLLWHNIIIYTVLVLVTILVFFLSMWSTHNFMAGAKKRELAVVHERLVKASIELKDRVVQDKLVGIERLSSSVAALETYKRLVEEVPEWPFNVHIIRRLAASILVPGVVYLIKILSGLGLRF